MNSDSLCEGLVLAVVSSGVLLALVTELLHRTRPGRQLDTARALKDQADILREIEDDSARPDATGTGVAFAIRLSLKKQVLNELVPPFGTLRLIVAIVVSLTVMSLGVLLCAAGLWTGIVVILLGAILLALFVAVAIGTARVETIAWNSMNGAGRQLPGAGNTTCQLRVPKTYKAWVEGGSKPGGEIFGALEKLAVDGSVQSVVRSLTLSVPTTSDDSCSTGPATEEAATPK